MPELDANGSINVEQDKGSAENVNEQTVDTVKNPIKNPTYLICHADKVLDLETIYQYGLKLKELNAGNPEITHLFIFGVDENGNVDRTQVMGLKIDSEKSCVVKVPTNEMEQFGKELGLHLFDEQISLCKFTENELNELLLNMNKEIDKQKKVFITLGACIGAIISISLF